jgi:hypothetical protein
MKEWKRNKRPNGVTIVYEKVVLNIKPEKRIY